MNNNEFEQLLNATENGNTLSFSHSCIKLQATKPNNDTLTAFTMFYACDGVCVCVQYMVEYIYIFVYWILSMHSFNCHIQCCALHMSEMDTLQRTLQRQLNVAINTMFAILIIRNYLTDSTQTKPTLKERIIVSYRILCVYFYDYIHISQHGYNPTD